MTERRRSILSVIALGHLNTHWNQGAFLLMLPLIAAEFNLSYALVGIISAVRFMVSAGVNLPGSAVVDMLGKRTGALMLSMAVPAFGYLLLTTAPSVTIVFLSYALIGFGASLWHPPAMSLLSSLLPERRGFAMATHEFGAGLGDLLSPITFGFILSMMSWRGAAALNIIPGSALMVLLWFTIPNRLAASGPGKRLTVREYKTAVGKLFQNPVMMSLTAVSAMRTSGQHALFTFLPLFLAKEWGLDSKTIGLYIGSITVASLFTAPLIGSLSDRIGRTPIIMVSMALAGVCGLLLGVMGQGVGFLLMLFFLGLFMFSARPLIFAAALDATPEETGASTVGLIFSANQLLAAFTPVVVGYFADTFGGVTAFYFAGAFLLTGSALSLIAMRPLPVSDRITVAG